MYCTGDFEPHGAGGGSSLGQPGLLTLFKNNHFTEMCSGSETVAYLRLIDSCITQLKAQGPPRTCNESKEEEEEEVAESQDAGTRSPAGGALANTQHRFERTLANTQHRFERTFAHVKSGWRERSGVAEAVNLPI